jgi:hypothetical protein
VHLGLEVERCLAVVAGLGVRFVVVVEFVLVVVVRLSFALVTVGFGFGVGVGLAGRFLFGFGGLLLGLVVIGAAVLLLPIDDLLGDGSG